MKAPSPTASFFCESTAPDTVVSMTSSSSGNKSTEAEELFVEQLSRDEGKGGDDGGGGGGGDNDDVSPKAKELFGFYRDHAFDPVYKPERTEDQEPRSRAGTPAKFPDTLYKMLKESEDENLEGIVGWQQHGRCFIVRKPSEFVEKIMHKYFKQSRYASFQRQLSMYGFARCTTGRDKGAYWHELFIRGRPDLLLKLLHVHRTKDPGHRMPQERKYQPDFYRLPPCGQGNAQEMPTEDRVTDSMNACFAAMLPKKKKTAPTEHILRPLRMPGRLLNALKVKPPTSTTQQSSKLTDTTVLLGSNCSDEHLIATVSGSFPLLDLIIPDDVSSESHHSSAESSSTMTLTEEVMDSFIADEPGFEFEHKRGDQNGVQPFVDPIFLL